MGSSIRRLVFGTHVSAGERCMVTNLKLSTGDPQWAFGSIALYDSNNQLAGDLDGAIANLTSH